MLLLQYDEDRCHSGLTLASLINATLAWSVSRVHFPGSFLWHHIRIAVANSEAFHSMFILHVTLGLHAGELN